MPVNHLRGSGCPKCGKQSFSKNKTSSINLFIEKANKIHNNEFDYSKSIYTKNNNKIEIICSKHGSFFQRPSDHLSGCKCPNCSNAISRHEDKYFESLNNPNIIRNQMLYIKGRKIIPDGYDPVTNTIYEFNGDYWHGNPKIYNKNDINKHNKKTFGELYKKTIEKENFLKNCGYNVISIWESDFEKR
jgi:endogenous inhibitor of DNA gyrase (YacG/DUF329 family)